MVALIVIFLLFCVLGVAGALWGVDSRDGRDWQPLQDPRPSDLDGASRRPSAARRRGRIGPAVRAARSALSEFWTTQVELQQRLDLLNRPWEQDFLHWAGQGSDRRLHGTCTPPTHRRRYSTTAAGWCPCRDLDPPQQRTAVDRPRFRSVGCGRPE